MGKQSRRRQAKQSLQTNIEKFPVLSPEKLMEQGNYEGAASILRDELAKSPNDKQRRLLFNCLVTIKEYREAIALLLDAEAPTLHDFILISWAYIQLGEWQEASNLLRSSLKIKENPEIYYWIAHAEAKGEPDYKLDASSKTAVLDALSKATALDGCRVEAFLWLCDLQWRDEVPKEISAQNRAEVLKQALVQHQNSEEVRTKLAAVLVTWLDEFEQALEVLASLLAKDKPSQEALWWAFRATEGKGDWKGALKYLDEVQIDPPSHYHTHPLEGIQIIRGDVLLRHGKYEDALAQYSKVEECEKVSYRIISRFRRAWTHLEQKNVSEALNEARHATEQYLSYREYLEDHIDVHAGGEYFQYGEVESLIPVCKAILRMAKEGRSIENHLIGAAIYILYNQATSTELREEIIPLLPKETNSMLLLAAEYLEFPVYLGRELAWELLDENLPKAVQYHLTYCLWEYETEGECDSTLTENIYSDEAKEKFNTQIHQKRGEIHNVAMKYLRGCSDTAVLKAVFLPFYDDLWRSLLLDGKMYKELAEVSSILVRGEDQGSIMWDSAYSHHMIGQVDEAERAYRQLLKLSPNNTSSLHNLALILEDKGALLEAFELSSKAASLKPDDTLIVKESVQLQAKVQKLQKEQQRREEFLRTAVERWYQLDRYKRQLLSVLTLVSGFDGADWEHLISLSGIEEKYIRGHWRKLTELGMVIEGADGVWRVNDHVLDLIKRERSHAIVTKIIHAEPTIAFKPIFNSELEYKIYRLLVGFFPNHLVFPNMSLQSIFQYDRLKSMLSADEFRYYLMAHVDFCITSTANYLPVIGFEVDSPYHDAEDQKARDEIKNRIFQLGGVPLLRLRALGQPTDEIIRQQIIQTIQALGSDLAKTHRQAGTYVNVALEIDFEQFRADIVQNDSQKIQGSAALPEL